jgi:hypothetical protein
MLHNLQGDPPRVARPSRPSNVRPNATRNLKHPGLRPFARACCATNAFWSPFCSPSPRRLWRQRSRRPLRRRRTLLLRTQNDRSTSATTEATPPIVPLARRSDTDRWPAGTPESAERVRDARRDHQLHRHDRGALHRALRRHLVRIKRLRRTDRVAPQAEWGFPFARWHLFE